MYIITSRKSNRKPQRVVMNANDRAYLTDRKRSLENALKADKEIKKYSPTTGFAQGNRDKGSIMKELALVNKTLENKAPRDYPSAQRNKLFKIAQAAKEKIKEGMPTKSEMWAPTPENLEKQRKWREGKEKLRRVYRNIMRTLDKENPNIGSIETLRKKV